MRCSGDHGHEMVKGSKFCGECGKPPGASEDMVKCAHCSTQMLKAAKFCGDCGTKAGSTEEELDASLAQLASFSKASVEREEDLAGLPPIDANAANADDKRIDAIIKAAVDGATDGNYDALPLIDAIMKAQNGLGVRVQTYAEHGQKWDRHLADGIRVMMKAVSALAPALGARLKAVEDKLDAIGNASRGRRTGAAVLELFSKSTTGKDGERVVDGGGDELRGRDLMVKAKLGYERDLTLREPMNVSRLEEYTAGGMDAAGIAANDPQLGSWLARCLKSADAAA